MSRETHFKEGAWIGGYEYSTGARLKEDIAKHEADVAYYKERLLALVMATPKDITPDGDDPMEHVKQTFDEIWGELRDLLFRLSDLYTVQLNEDCVEKWTNEQASGLQYETDYEQGESKRISGGRPGADGADRE